MNSTINMPWSVGLLLFALTACSPISVVIDDDPIACTNSADTSGYRLTLKFTPDEDDVDDDSHIVQMITTKRSSLNTLIDPCVEFGETVITGSEIFRTPGIDHQRVLRNPAEHRGWVEVEGWVAYVEELDDHPFPTIPAGEDAEFLRLTTSTGADVVDNNGNPVATWANDLPEDVRNELQQSLRDDDLLISRYKYRYEFDGCSAPDEWATICEEQHCLNIEFWDMRGGEAKRRKKKEFEASLDTPGCQDMD